MWQALKGEGGIWAREGNNEMTSSPPSPPPPPRARSRVLIPFPFPFERLPRRLTFSQLTKIKLGTLFFHFFTVVFHDYNVKLRNFLGTRFFFWEEMLNVFLFTFFVAAAHFHLGGTQHFPFSHRRYKIFMFFFQRNWSPFVFSHALALSLLSIH